MKLSVIMPVYNTKEEYLKEAIESILNQTYSDFEFIIINDGSTNNAEDMILSYKDNRIKYFKQENQGISNARNNAIKIAKGEIIALMDSDDISLAERFEKQIKFLDENPKISVVGTWFEMFPKIRTIKHPKYPKFLDFYKTNCIGNPMAMFRKYEFQKYNLNYKTEFKTAQDFDLWSRAVRYLNFANIEEVLLKYRWHKESISHIKPENQLQNTLKIQQNMLDFLTDDKNLQNEIRKLIFPPPLIKQPTFLQQIFSIRNENGLKVIRILGVKIKRRIERRKKKKGWNCKVL